MGEAPSFDELVRTRREHLAAEAEEARQAARQTRAEQRTAQHTTEQKREYWLSFRADFVSRVSERGDATRTVTYQVEVQRSRRRHKVVRASKEMWEVRPYQPGMPWTKGWYPNHDELQRMQPTPGLSVDTEGRVYWVGLEAGEIVLSEVEWFDYQLEAVMREMADFLVRPGAD